MKCYLVMKLETTFEAKAMPWLGEMKLGEDGLVGVLPVFNDLAQAEEFAEGKYEIIAWVTASRKEQSDG